MRYEIFKEVMLRLLHKDIDWKSLAKEATPIEQELKLQLNDTLQEIIHKERLRKRYLRIIEAEAEPDEDIVTKFRDTGIELRKLKDRKESLERSINTTAAPKLTKLPTIEINETRAESNLRLKDEIRKRIAQIQLTFKANIITAPDPNRVVAGIRPGKGQIVAKITFTNGAVKWAFIDGLKANLLSGGDFKRLA
jgi:hypothetical protein